MRFFLAAALTASQTPGNYAPFALGCMAAAGTGVYGGAALAGNVLGALLFLDFASALPHVATAILILVAATTFQGSRMFGTPKILAATAGVLSLAVGGIYVTQSLSPMEQLAPCLAAAGLTGAAAWFFLPVLQQFPQDIQGLPPADQGLFFNQGKADGVEGANGDATQGLFPQLLRLFQLHEHGS